MHASFLFTSLHFPLSCSSPLFVLFLILPYTLFVCSVGPLRCKPLLTTLSSVSQLWSRLPAISSRCSARLSYFKGSFDLIRCLSVELSHSISYRAYLIIKFICSWRLQSLLPSTEVLMGYLSFSFKAKSCQCQFSSPIICPSTPFSFKELDERVLTGPKKSYYKVFKCRQSVLCSGCRKQHSPN